ncbi:hypothetical protein [Joostella sp. CR20]|uniref:hypothetical protein n=1 Tax=Joostella sp. CR20 TaxID=2804312 RepID=UPI00313D2822
MFFRFFIGVVFLLSVFQSFGQKVTGFKTYKNFSLRGDSRVIGNNVVSIHSKDPYNDVGHFAKKNDRLPMVYIDIDNDPNTFSSSSATLAIPESASSIAYAGLYWAATYEHEEAEMKRGKTEYEYVPVKPRVDNYNNVLLKTPQQSYQSISGTILEDYKDSIGRPYLCYADVTKTLQSIPNASGVYTVANVHATQGHILGGSSGGWMLYVIYNDDTTSNKKFVLQNGFQSVEKNEYELTIAAQDSASTNITLGVLEGDERLKTDKVSLVYSEDEKPQMLFSPVRAEENFFNSSITLNDEVFLKRTPNSINTLGFDIASFNLPLDKSKISEEVKLNLTTVRDKFLLFFSALQTNVIEASVPVVTPTKVEAEEVVVRVVEDKQIENASAIKVRQTLKISSQKPGYYLITNVFSDKTLAEKWKTHLRSEGFSPESFISPKNNWEYVYVNYSEQIQDLYVDYNRFKSDDTYSEIWILEIKD